MNSQSPRPGPAVFKPTGLVPTEEQLKIQTAVDRTLIVEANAGAAKTTTLALRMAETWQGGTAPELFLALTYTDTACDALKAALKKIGVPLPVASRFRIQTFETFCKSVLVDMLGAGVQVFSQAEQLKPFVWQAIQRVEDHAADDRWRSELVMPSLGDNAMVEEFLALNQLLKGTMRDTCERDDQAVTPDYAESIRVDYTLLKIFLAYEGIRRRENAERPLFRGPSDATYDLAWLLHQGESLAGLKSWPWSNAVLMVDEMHDLNKAMFTVLQALLSTTSSDFCGVGDIDQVLYKSAGADARFMDDEIERVTPRRVARYPLTQSYRFAKSLAAKAGRVAGKPYSSAASHATAVSVVGYEDTPDCTEQITQEVLRFKAKPKAKMNEFAILLRHSWQSVGLENALLEKGIPYSMRGLDSYLMRPEVLFVRGLLAVATDNIGSIADKQTREQVLHALVLFSGSKIEVKGREHESQDALMKDAVRSVMEAPGFLVHFFENQVLRTAGPQVNIRLQAALKIARENAGPEVLTHMLQALNIESLVNELFVSRQRREDALKNLQGLQQAAMKSDSAAAYFQVLNASETRQRLLKKSASLLIAHVAEVKGLEFDHVVLPYLEKDVFPAGHADAREEQNLFYVGMTRARLALTMLAKNSAPSLLLKKMGDNELPLAPGQRGNAPS